MCPEERLRRRLQWNKILTLHKRTSDLSGESIISMHPLDSPLVVYSQKEWWSDEWNPLDYGRDFDFSRPFFEQFAELMRIVPHMSLENQYDALENSDYVNCCG